MKLIYFLLNFVLLSNFCFSQKTFISVHVSGAAKNTIKYSNYIDHNYFLGLTQFEGNTVKNIDSTFNLELELKSEIFFRLVLNNQAGATLAISPSDSIDIKFTLIRDSINKRTKLPSYSVDITKSNYQAHAVYRERFNPIAKTFVSIDSLVEIYSDYKSAGTLYERCKEVISKKLKVWDSLLVKKEISPTIYKLYLQDTKAGMYRHLARYFSTKKARTKDLPLVIYYDSLLQKIYFEQGAQDKYLLKTYIGSRFHEVWLTDKIIRDTTIKDTLLKQIYESFFYLYDSTYREKAWGNSVLSPAINAPFNENVADKANAIVFAKYYPNSRYLKKMNAIYDSVRMDRQRAYSHQEIVLKNYESLKEIFDFHKERFFFIDVWATWCAPCIGEFAYTSQLEKQLDSLKIKKIYLSIDERRDSTKWKEIIKKYYLNGYHYFADKKIQVEILEHLLQRKESGGLNIPQYFIFDKLKNKFYMNLSRPSSESVLYEEILKIVKME